MRISDWSSDVCSSDLAQRAGLARRGPGMLDLAEDLRLAQHQRVEPGRDPEQVPHRVAVPVVVEVGVQGLPGAGSGVAARSEERRVGTEGVGTGRSRWLPYH